MEGGYSMTLKMGLSTRAREPSRAARFKHVQLECMHVKLDFYAEE